MNAVLITLRVTKAERDAIRRDAALSGVSMQNYIRGGLGLPPTDRLSNFHRAVAEAAAKHEVSSASEPTQRSGK